MLSENFKNISLETQVSFVTSRNNLKTFSGLVIIWLRFLTWHSSTSCMLPYSALNKIYKVSLLTPYFNNHKWVPFTQTTKHPEKFPWIIIQTLDAHNHREIKRFLFFEKRPTLNVTAECIRKSQAKFIGSLPLNHSPAQAVVPGSSGRSDCN